MKIPLGECYAYGRVLEEPDYAFYDVCSQGDLGPEEIAKREILFRVAAMKRAETSGRWSIIGYAPLEPVLQEPGRYFRQDALDPRKLWIYVEGSEVPATWEECQSLERVAVWEPEHIEDRLRDHFAGRPNKWVESMRLKPRS